MMTEQEKKDRREARKIERLHNKAIIAIVEERNQKPVKSITISIEWKKSYMWGFNPHATAKVEYMDGDFERREGYTASGCGYDKESTVIAAVFNDFLKYRLWEKSVEECKRADYNWKKNGGAPYGVKAGVSDRRYGVVEYRGFSGGIGTDCYRDISTFIGGTWKSIAHGKSFDVYGFVDGVNEK